MAQEKIKINGELIYQPDEELLWSYETTYTPDSTRTLCGEGHFTEMFTTESFAYAASHMPTDEWAKLSRMIVGKKYDLYAYNPHFGKWMTMRCYTGEGSLKVKTLTEGGERFASVSFSMIDVMPLEMQS